MTIFYLVNDDFTFPPMVAWGKILGEYPKSFFFQSRAPFSDNFLQMCFFVLCHPFQKVDGLIVLLFQDYSSQILRFYQIVFYIKLSCYYSVIIKIMGWK